MNNVGGSFIGDLEICLDRLLSLPPEKGRTLSESRGDNVSTAELLRFVFGHFLGVLTYFKEFLRRRLLAGTRSPRGPRFLYAPPSGAKEVRKEIVSQYFVTEEGLPGGTSTSK